MSAIWVYINKRKAIFLPIAIFSGALLVAVILWLTAPEAKKGNTKSIATIVDVAPIEHGDFPVFLEAMGEVIASQQIELGSDVSGRIDSVSPMFVPGGLVKRGDFLLQIEQSDYLLEVKKKQALLQQANAAFEIEKGKQENARKELDLLRKDGRPPKDTYLVLRGPQLKQAEAERDRAQAELEMAKLNLSRTSIYAPFNALIVATHVNLGARTSQQQQLATLVATNEYWVQISVPSQHLQWLDIGEAGSLAKVHINGSKQFREARVARLVGRLEQGSRLAPLIVSVLDPLLLNTGQGELSAPLLLGDYVAVTIKGRMLKNVYRVAHHHVRNNNILWAARDQKMVFVPVETLYKDRDFIYFNANLQPNEKVITSNILTPVDGMSIQLSNRQTAVNNKHPQSALVTVKHTNARVANTGK